MAGPLRSCGAVTGPRWPAPRASATTASTRRLCSPSARRHGGSRSSPRPRPGTPAPGRRRSRSSRGRRREVHRLAPGEIGVGRPMSTWRYPFTGPALVADVNSAGPVQVERGRAALAGHLEAERVRQARRRSGTPRTSVRAPGERRGERRESSFSTGSRTSPTGTPPACPTAVPSGTGRSGLAVFRTVPCTHRATGPQRNSPTSTRWLPMSASAPEPGRRGNASSWAHRGRRRSRTSTAR